MIYTAILMRDSCLDNDGGYINGFTDSDLNIRAFTRVEDLKDFVVPFMVESRRKAAEDRSYSHEVSVLVNGVPGKGSSSSAEIELAPGLQNCGAYEEATKLEEDIEELVKGKYQELRAEIARKANDARLAAERSQKEANERRERTQYENLRKKFEGA